MDGWDGRSLPYLADSVIEGRAIQNTDIPAPALTPLEEQGAKTGGSWSEGPVIGCWSVSVQAAQPVRLNVQGTGGDHFHGPSVSLAAHTTKKDPGWC